MYSSREVTYSICVLKLKVSPAMPITAELKWLSPEMSGRTRAPAQGSKYSTLARFSHEREVDWLKESWSLIVYPLEPADPSGFQECHVEFLSEHAPTGWLIPGAHFALYEGATKVAEGKVSYQPEP